MLATAFIYYLEKYNKPNEYYNTNKMYQEIISETLCTSCRGKLLREVIIYGLTRGNLGERKEMRMLAALSIFTKNTYIL